MEMPPGPPPLGGPPVVAPPLGRPEPHDAHAPPPPPGGDEANRRLVATTAALALLAVAVMIGVFLLTQDPDDEEARPAPVIPQATVPDEVAPPTSTEGGEAIDEAALEAEVADISDFVEAERGLEFTEAVDVEVLADAEYADRVREGLEEDLAEDPEDVEEDFGFLIALGLWDPTTDPADLLSEFIATGSLGFYDPMTDELVVRGGEISPLVRTTLAHELTHAIEDQVFDLDRPDLGDRPDESSIAFSAVVEGSAGRIEDAYRETLTDEERTAEAAEESALASEVDPASFPGILLAQQSFVYDRSGPFLDALIDDGGQEALDRALRRPPTTTEAILEPETYLDDQQPAPVEAPAGDGEVVDEGVAGQFLLHLLVDLEEALGGSDSDGVPLPEWDGDHYVQWRDGDAWCVRIAVAGDAERFEVGLQRYVDDAPYEGEVTVDGDVVELSMCSS